MSQNKRIEQVYCTLIQTIQNNTVSEPWTI